MDAPEWLARLANHIPDPGKQSVGSSAATPTGPAARERNWRQEAPMARSRPRPRGLPPRAKAHPAPAASMPAQPSRPSVRMEAKAGSLHLFAADLADEHGRTHGLRILRLDPRVPGTERLAAAARLME